MDILRFHLSIEEYGVLLQRLWGFYTPLETLIAKKGEWPFSTLDYDRRKKIPLLEHDLHALGLFTPSFLPICTRLPELTDLPQVLGCMYVLEGATLGGQVISRHMKKVFDIDQTTGCAYFCSYGAELSSMWKTFCYVLTTHASTYTIENQILQAACSTFITFNAWLDEATHIDLHEAASPRTKSSRGLLERKHL